MDLQLSKDGLQHVIDTLKKGVKWGLVDVDMGRCLIERTGPPGCGTAGCFAGTYGAVTLLEDHGTLEVIEFDPAAGDFDYWTHRVACKMLGLRFDKRDKSADWSRMLESVLEAQPEVWGNTSGALLFVSPCAFGCDATDGNQVKIVDVVRHLEGVLARI